MIVTLPAYLFSLRLSGVLEVDTLLVAGVLLLLGRILAIAFVCVESANGEQTYPGLWLLSDW